MYYVLKDIAFWITRKNIFDTPLEGNLYQTRHAYLSTESNTLHRYEHLKDDNTP